MTFIAVGTARCESIDEGFKVGTVPPSLGKVGCSIPPGHRAVTIEVYPQSGCGPYGIPGSHFDVILTYLDAADGINKTRPIVEDVILLSVGHRDVTRPGGDTRLVTLSMPLKEVLLILTAKPLGHLSLVLRPNQDVCEKPIEPEPDLPTSWRERREPMRKLTKSTYSIKGDTYVLDADKHWVKTLASQE